MNWKHGYYADSGYTYGYYAETSPLRLAWAAMLQGHQVPMEGFRYLDAGCGQGLSLILMAAAHPDAEFVGVDFLPEHVAHAAELAHSCRLRNVRFVEGDFIALHDDPSALGRFDYAVCHGISTWIAPQVKEALFGLIGKVLLPGGLFYNSYNTLPGWLGAVPFQHLVLLEQRSKAGPLALKSARESMDKLKEAGKVLFAALPGLSGQLDKLDKLDAAYLVQEYNNQHWRPVFVTQMMDDMAAVKLSYLGTATLPEAFESSYVAALREVMAAQQSAALREQLRDFGVNQAFRRDLYVKGRSQPWAAQQLRRLRAFRFVRNRTVERPEVGTPFSIKAGTIELNGEAGIYGGLLDRLESSPDGLTVGEAIDVSPQLSWVNTVATLSMLLHGGWAMLHHPEGNEEVGRSVNSALAQAVCSGAPYRYLSLPRTGAALQLSDSEWFVLAAAIEGRAKEQWADSALATLKQLGRGLAREGKVVTEAHEEQALMQRVVDQLGGEKLAFFRQMGAW